MRFEGLKFRIQAVGSSEAELSAGAEAGESDARGIEVEFCGVGGDVEDSGDAVFDAGGEGMGGRETVSYAYEHTWGGGMGGDVLSEAGVIFWVADYFL